jgi:hypothetical protein
VRGVKQLMRAARRGTWFHLGAVITLRSRGRMPASPPPPFPFYNLDALLSSLLSVCVLSEIVLFGGHSGSRQSPQTDQNR